MLSSNIVQSTLSYLWISAILPAEMPIVKRFWDYDENMFFLCFSPSACQDFHFPV